MSIVKIKSFPAFEDINIEKFSDSFVPYLYLDGHRSSNIGNSDSKGYDSGFKFFLRFARIMKQLGFKNMVTMVHTSRNHNVKGRLDSIHSAIQKNFIQSNGDISKSSFKLYGDIESYKTMGYDDFYNFLKEVDNRSDKETAFTNHILINYSEDWALKNLEKINSIPSVSSVIRFTKGFVSGGWIPVKMQETTFVYSQIPSISEFWSDEAITVLILIALKNWSAMNQYIGEKVYKQEEKELIHSERDLELKLSINKVHLNNTMNNRIITFGIDGPALYELQF
jgi:hypothetical protein